MSIDPVGASPEKPFSVNRYAYANNNPYRYVDPDGRWASQAGFYVHQRVTFLEIGRYLPKGQNAILASAHVYADGKDFQSGDTAFRHAMSGPNDTPESARAKANTFVREQYQKAWNASDQKQSLFEFWVALHVLQDSTSPSHAGFQQWTGEESKGEEISHVSKEMLDPGKDSNLHKITKDAWGWFQSKKLPDGDLFKYAADK